MIELTNISKTYAAQQGPHTVLKDINLKISRGEKVGILGVNGAGKSTLIQLLSGSLMPSAGKIQRDMKISWPLAFSGGFQGSLTGIDNLRFICRIYGVPFEPLLPFVKEFTELKDFLYEPLKNYSSGMKARLAFAASMAVEFDCYLIDEIFAVGDARFHERCNDELFNKRRDRAYVMVSHSENIIRQHCDRAYVLHDTQLHPFESLDKAFDFYLENSYEKNSH
jgi:capsular polysaccharide transport system ATP-binding protein